MKTLKNILFAAAVMICFSMTASAQKEGDKNNPPPKDKNPPVIVIKPKDPPKDPPKDDKKKPQAVIIYNRNEINLG